MFIRSYFLFVVVLILNYVKDWPPGGKQRSGIYNVPLGYGKSLEFSG